MDVVYADSCYWIALLNRKDDLHAVAVDVSKGLGSSRIVTCEMVLTEVLNGFSNKGHYLREKALQMVEAIRNNPNVTVVPQTSKLFTRAMERFKDRPDKGYSLTDCASMLIMEDEDITSALTHDHHFEQAGFEAMLQAS